MANGGSGISFAGAESHDNTIGGTTPGAGNTIAYNGSDGITVVSGTHQTLQGNAIFGNGDLAIDLNNDGVTSNDVGDGDVGPNDRQNFPVLTSATSAEVTGTVASSSATSLRIELFASPACDASGHGEGARFVAAVDVVTDGSGNAAFTAPVSGLTAGEAVTATATSASGNTSEFSLCEPLEDVAPAVGRVRVGKVTEPAGGAGFEFVGPAGGDGSGDGPLGDGDAVVFVRFSGPGVTSLHVLDVASGEVSPIAGTANTTYPEFSPDNARVAFGGSNMLRVLDVASGDVDTIVTGLSVQSSSWSPDGAWIVFGANDQLWVVPSDGSEAATQVTTGTASTYATWGPDGTIAFRSNRAGGFIRVATFDAATRSLVGVHGLANTVGFNSQQREMHWSPDGSRIVAGGAFNAASTDNLFLVPADGVGSVQQLTNDAASEAWPTWSADGSSIVFASDRNGVAFQLFRMPADLSAPAELFVDDGFSDYQADWGRVAFTTDVCARRRRRGGRCGASRHTSHVHRARQRRLAPHLDRLRRHGSHDRPPNRHRHRHTRPQRRHHLHLHQHPRPRRPWVGCGSGR